MQPHPPQLPVDDATRPVPKSFKKGALGLLLVAAIIAVLLAFLLPKKQMEAIRAGTPTQQEPPSSQRVQADAYKAPTQ